MSLTEFLTNSTFAASAGNAGAGFESTFVPTSTLRQLLQQVQGPIFTPVGALGDGITDDSKAIQAAIEAAKVVSGTVYLPKPPVRYVSNVALTLYENVALIGDDMKTCQIAFPKATNGINLKPAAFGTVCARICNLSLAGTIAVSAIGLDLQNCQDLLLDRVQVTGFKSGNIRCLDFVSITLRDVSVGGGGDATHPNVLFDTTAAVSGNSNGIYGFNFKLSGGGASSVCGLRIERTNNAQFFGGYIQSAGVLAQISATNDGTDAKNCSAIAFYGTDFENPTNIYIETGTAWNTGLGTVALKDFTLIGVNGSLSGSTTGAIGVALRAIQGFTSISSNFVLGTVGTAMFDQISTVSGTFISPTPQAALAGGIYIRNGGSDTGALTTDTYTTGGYKASGDLNATGGYRQSIDGWYQNNVAANQNNVVLTRLATATEVPTRWIAPRAGSITGVWVKSDSARSAGTCTIFVFKNNASVGFSAILDGTNTIFKASTTAKDNVTFVAGDEIDVRVATDAGWLPTTANIRAGIDIET